MWQQTEQRAEPLRQFGELQDPGTPEVSVLPSHMQAGVYSLSHSPETEVTTCLHTTWLFCYILLAIKVSEAWKKM